VDDDGQQVWRGRVERRVHPDGWVEITRPDGSRSYRNQEASSDRHVFGPGNEVQELTVRPSGEVKVTLDDGTMWQNEIYSDIIRVLDREGYPILDAGRPRVLRGKLKVGPLGNLTYYSASSGDVTVFHANGATTRLMAMRSGGWVDPVSGRAYQTQTELVECLREIKAAMFRMENDHDMSLQTFPASTGTLAIGMEELITRSLEPIAEEGSVRRWRLGAGNELEARDGILTLRQTTPTRSTMTARRGNTGEWAQMREILLRLTASEYPIVAKDMPFKLERGPQFDSRDVKQWLAGLESSMRK
jgi:hypothetical protein